MTFDIPANDHGAIYVFELHGTPPEGLSEKTDQAMMVIFGNAVVNTDYIDAIMPGMLTDMTLPQLIKNGYDMPVAVDVADELRALTGTAVLAMSAAFGGQAMQLSLPQNVHLVTILREAPEIKLNETLASDSARGTLASAAPTKPPKSDARIGGMVATYALLAMFALVGLMIWVAS